MRLLWTYVFGIYSASTNVMMAYMWHELLANTIQHWEISTAALITFPLTIRGGETIILTIAYAKARTMIPILAFPFALNSFVIHTHLLLAYSARIITHFQKARKTAIRKVWHAKGPPG